MRQPDFWTQLFCRHRDLEFIRNIHGDEITDYNGYRSLWRCKKCDSPAMRREIREPTHEALGETHWKMATTTLGSAGLPIPEEMDGTRSGWAVIHLCRAVKDLAEKLHKAQSELFKVTTDRALLGREFVNECAKGAAAEQRLIEAKGVIAAAYGEQSFLECRRILKTYLYRPDGAEVKTEEEK